MLDRKMKKARPLLHFSVQHFSVWSILAPDLASFLSFPAEVVTKYQGMARQTGPKIAGINILCDPILFNAPAGAQIEILGRKFFIELETRNENERICGKTTAARIKKREACQKAFPYFCLAPQVDVDEIYRLKLRQIKAGSIGVKFKVVMFGSARDVKAQNSVLAERIPDAAAPPDRLAVDVQL